MSILPKPQSAAFSLGRVILLVYWDPAKAILSHRVPQLEHMRLLEQHRKDVMPDVTHFLHCRRRTDLKLSRIIAWLKMGHGLEGNSLLEFEGAFDPELAQSEEFQVGLYGGVVKKSSRPSSHPTQVLPPPPPAPPPPPPPPRARPHFLTPTPQTETATATAPLRSTPGCLSARPCRSALAAPYTLSAMTRTTNPTTQPPLSNRPAQMAKRKASDSHAVARY